MKASHIWRLENRRKYYCPCCNYHSHNRAIFSRHENTISHWLCKEFASAPRDIKMVVASFLPFSKINRCGMLAIDAFNLKLAARNATWRLRPAGLADPLAPTGVLVVPTKYMWRNQVSWLQRVQLYVPQTTIPAVGRAVYQNRSSYAYGSHI